MTTKHKSLVVFLTAFAVAIFSIVPTLVRAANPPFCADLQCLYPLTAYTYQILEKVNSLPDQLEKLVSGDLTDTKGSDAITADIIANFAKLGDALTKENVITNPGLQREYLQAFFGLDAKDTASVIPYANDLAYQTLLDMPYLNPDPRENAKPRPDPKMNYLKNVSGFLVSHTPPGSNWAGSKEDQYRYFYFYNTISAIQTFNGYTLTQLLTQAKTFSDTQAALIAQANSKAWIEHVATEQIGKVLRQNLLFNSQIFVLLSQMLENQKKQLLEQSMTNTLLVLSNMPNEELLIKKATGEIKSQ